jgi:hypothetical protein
MQQCPLLRESFDDITAASVIGVVMVMMMVCLRPSGSVKNFLDSDNSTAPWMRSV